MAAAAAAQSHVSTGSAAQAPPTPQTSDVVPERLAAPSLCPSLPFVNTRVEAPSFCSGAATSPVSCIDSVLVAAGDVAVHLSAMETAAELEGFWGFLGGGWSCLIRIRI